MPSASHDSPPSNSSSGSPTYTPSETPPVSASDREPTSPQNSPPTAAMDSTEVAAPVKSEAEATQPTETPQVKAEAAVVTQQPAPADKKKSKKHCCKNSKKKSTKAIPESSSDSSDDSFDEDSDSESDASEESTESDDDSTETSEDEKERLRREKKKKRARKAQEEKRRARRKAKSRKRTPPSDTEPESEEESNEASADDEDSSEEEKPKKTKRKVKRGGKRRSRKAAVESDSEQESEEESEDEGASRKKSRKSKKSKKKSRKGKGRKARGSTNSFKRLDQLWDTTVHDWKISETADAENEESHADCAFAVRRKFDWDNKYEATYCDINSKHLKEALAVVFDGVSGISLVEETPSLDPNMLFLYFDEIKAIAKKTKVEAKEMKKKRKKKALLLKGLHLKLLLKYLDEDYTDIRKRLHPMLESGQISFDLLWALFKPNTIAYTTTYNAVEVPRAFKIESATKESSFMRGTWYNVTGRYLEFDGDNFGLGTTYVDVDQWKGSKKITSLPCYPMKYHRSEAAMRKQLIERGRKFVGLAGQHHMAMTGLAFYKRKKAIVKVNITSGRVMISPALFRRINPNYPISQIKRRTDEDEDSEDECSDSDCCCHADGTDDESTPQAAVPLGEEEAPEKTVRRFIKDPKTGKWEMVTFNVDADGDIVMPAEKLERDGEEKQEFTDEDLLIAGPVVLGFAFSEKLWLELSLEGIEDIKWQPEAFDSLVLASPTHKAVMRALVEMNRDKFQSTKNIQDVVQKKGAGLIAVLHGPPGTGKTLTAEGIAELLECPLYQVSAGELGTDPRTLEGELNKLLDITHSWNAILLLDEADVFLEQRVASDIHRNALVSIFLRLLEYHQGILMMTTNRVETFDEAFQSRIHIALRYAELTPKARKSIWKTFLVKAHEKDNSASFTDEDYEALSRRSLNGRQIKNTVRTSISLALSRKESLNMSTLKEVLEVQADFERDLKGGTGYKDAMASYF